MGSKNKRTIFGAIFELPDSSKRSQKIVTWEWWRPVLLLGLKGLPSIWKSQEISNGGRQHFAVHCTLFFWWFVHLELSVRERTFMYSGQLAIILPYLLYLLKYTVHTLLMWSNLTLSLNLSEIFFRELGFSNVIFIPSQKCEVCCQSDFLSSHYSWSLWEIKMST